MDINKIKKINQTTAKLEKNINELQKLQLKESRLKEEIKKLYTELNKLTV